MNRKTKNIVLGDAEKLERNTAKMSRLRAYRTLVLTVTIITVGFYIAGAVYALVLL